MEGIGEWKSGGEVGEWKLCMILTGIRGERGGWGEGREGEGRGSEYRNEAMGKGE